MTFEEHEKKMQEWLERRPKCRLCHEPIQDETAYELPLYGIVCPECISECEFVIGED